LGIYVKSNLEKLLSSYGVKLMDDDLIFGNLDFRLIQETENYILGYICEQAYLIEKSSKRDILLCEFYGVCDAGVINDREKWCVVGGDIIAIWKNDNITIIDNDELKWVFDMRLKDNNTVEILIDPWSKNNNSAIWELNVEVLVFKKIKDFDY
jgi:hypothetical protein